MHLETDCLNFCYALTRGVRDLSYGSLIGQACKELMDSSFFFG